VSGPLRVCNDTTIYFRRSADKPASKKRFQSFQGVIDMKTMILIAAAMLIYILVLSASCWLISTFAGLTAKACRKIIKKLRVT